MFYPDIKPHISPSALAQWHNQKSLFIRSYFKGEKSPETAAMRMGKKLHALIEGGFSDAQNKFGNEEKPITIELGRSGINVYGIPDSYETTNKSSVCFVDYKTGKENHFDKLNLATDLKMLTTAWLVWKMNPKAKEVQGIIEWFETKWNDENGELEPTGKKETICHIYYEKDLARFTSVINSTIDAINAAYEKFLSGEGMKDTEALINLDDIKEYAELETKKQEIEAQQKELKGRIGEQMAFVEKQSFESEVGTFYFTERKTYKYPDDLEFQTEDGMVMTLAVGEQVEAAMGAVKKQYEMEHEPETVSKSLSFRAKKKK